VSYRSHYIKNKHRGVTVGEYRKGITQKTSKLDIFWRVVLYVGALTAGTLLTLLFWLTLK